MTVTETRPSSYPSQARSGPPLGRHAAAVGLTVVLMLGLYWLAGSDSLTHAVPADASLVLLCLILILGAGARLVPRLRRYTPWRRELGIAMFVTASLHVALLNDFDLDVTGFFGKSTSCCGFIFRDGIWEAANWVGLLALGYALVLAATSNDWSQRKLGRGWKFLHQQTYTLFVLAWLHTAAFVLLFRPFHSPILWDLQWLFWGVTLAAVATQFAGFVRTVRAPRKPARRSVPPTSGFSAPGGPRMHALKWFGVVALWGVLILGSWVRFTLEFAGDQ